MATLMDQLMDENAKRMADQYAKAYKQPAPYQRQPQVRQQQPAIASSPMAAVQNLPPWVTALARRYEQSSTGYEGDSGRQISGAALAQQPEPGYSGDAGRMISGAARAAQPAAGYEGPMARQLSAIAAQNQNMPEPGYSGASGALVPQRPTGAGTQRGDQQFGPVNMNVIKGLNQYAQMNSPQAYADQFAGGDLSKIRARTYRDEEGNAYNDYYVKGLLGG